MSQARHLMHDIDRMVTARKPAECGRLFQRLAHLHQDFSLKSDQDQLSVFDDVFVRLLPGCDRETLLSLTLFWARSPFAPKRTLMALALHPQQELSIPVLVHARVFDEQDLWQIAKQANQAQQLVLSTRANLPALASDYLIVFGSPEVRAVLAANQTAQFSRSGALLRDSLRQTGVSQSVPSQEVLVLQTRLGMVALRDTDGQAGDQAGDTDRFRSDAAFEAAMSDLLRQKNWPDLLAHLALRTGLSAGAMVRALLGPDLRPLLQLLRALDCSWPGVEAVLGARLQLGAEVPAMADVRSDYLQLDPQQARMAHDFLVRRSRQTQD